VSRHIVVGSVSELPTGPDFDSRHERASALVQRAARLGANVLAFPETYHHTGLPGSIEEQAQPLDGPSLARMAQEAKKHALHLVWPLYTFEDGRIYNSSVLLSPDGERIGVYHKMFPTDGEIKSGITPGDGPRVFETELGRFGLTICFDMNFPEIMQGTADAGAEVIFFSSAYRGGLQARIWAFLTGAYFVTAILGPSGQIVDLSGQLLVESTYEALITRRLNLDRKLLHMDYNWDKLDAILAKYGPKVTIDFFTPEACWAIGSESEDFTVEDIIREFGLEKRADYFQRSREIRRAALPGG